MNMSKKRAHVRVPTSVGVSISLTDGTRMVGEKISNISLGGVFIEMAEPLAFGSELELEFTLPDAPRSLRCHGFVVWTTRGQTNVGPGQEGIGVRLLGVGLREMRLLAEFVEKQLKS
jgi:uncharacterized protein (TIGR02266 family)